MTVMVIQYVAVELYTNMQSMKKITSKETEEIDMHNMAEILKAMAHADRLAILNLLCKKRNEKLTVKNIYENLSMSQPVVSRHLNILKSAGVVRRLPEGQKIYYCLCTEKKNIVSLMNCFC